MTYNGWKNWETWNVKLWLDEEDYRPYVQGGPSGEGIREYVEEAYGPDGDWCSSCSAGPMADAWGMYLQAVDWAEIYDAYVEDLDDEEDE